MDNNKKLDYSETQELDYGRKVYIFNPYAMGVGLWSEKTFTGNASGIYADKDTQRKLNKIAFGVQELPNMTERLEASSGAKKARLRQISIEWLQAKFQLIKAGYQNVPDSSSRSSTGIRGMMCFYEYSPKLKDKLPMWDKFPLVIILEHYDDGFLGLNMHYASEGERTALLTSLLKTRIYSPELNSLKVIVDYDLMVRNIKKFPSFQKSIKRYLTQHIVGRVLEIKPHEWGLTTFLPSEEFVYNKKSKQ